MLRSVPPRLRASVTMLAGGAVVTAVAGAAWGWSSLLPVGGLAVVATIGYYFVASTDSDFGAMLRDQADERQAYRRLQMQALVGRVTTLAASIAYLAAALAKVPLWPFAIFIAVPGVTFLAGWLVYREPGDRRRQQPGH